MKTQAIPHRFCRVLAGVLLLAAFATAQTARALELWRVTNSGNVFTISRQSAMVNTIVQYRTVSLTALAGQNFTEASGTLVFGVGELSKQVTVAETAVGNLAVPYRYQTGTSRSYRFEVLNAGGAELAHCDRAIDYGSSHKIELEKFFKNIEIKVFSKDVTVDDVGYGTSPNTYHAIDISKYFNATAPQEFFAAIGTQLGMTFDFQVCEIEDGYQYLQILVDEDTNYDSGNIDGDVGPLQYAQLLAGFGHDPGVQNPNYAYYTFPYVTSGDVPYGCKDKIWERYGNTVGRLYSQKIKPGFQHGHTGRMLANADLQKLGVRFDASGKHDDKWKIKDFKAHVQAIDDCAPTLLESDVKISAGPYNAGTTFYLSVPFSEIVYAKESPTIYTSWGAMTYETGRGTNVLTFKGVVGYGLDTSTPLTITGLKGRIHDMRGNLYKGTEYINVTFPDYILSGQWGSDQGADGTEAHPYIISSTNDLNWLATCVNDQDYEFGPDANHPDGYFFELGDNIIYSYSAGANNYNPIGTPDNAFRGHFDGKGYSVKGIQIYHPYNDCQGLFGHVVGGTVKNVVVDCNGEEIWGQNYVGGIVGRCDGGTISGCFVINAEVFGNKYGIIVGNNSATLVDNYYYNCYATLDHSAYTNIGYYDDANGNGLTDKEGAAEPVYIITTLTDGLSAGGASATYDGVKYFAQNAEAVLSYSGEVAAGYNAIWYEVKSGDNATDRSGYGLVDGYTFLMPAVDMNASVNTSDLALALLDDDSARPVGKKNADYIAAGGSNKKVEIHSRRFYQDGEWNTVCLPFGVDNLANTPLANATVKELDTEAGSYAHQTGFDAGTGTLYLNFKNATSITAGVPYIIKWGNPEGENGYLGTAIDSPRFSGVNISSTTPSTVQSADGKVKFVGQYGPKAFAANDYSKLFVGDGNTLYYPQSGASINAFRAYFELVDANAPVMNIQLNFADNETTEIKTTDFTFATPHSQRENYTDCNEWFTLSGTRLTAKPTQKGVYIHNGRKIVIK